MMLENFRRKSAASRVVCDPFGNLRDGVDN